RGLGQRPALLLPLLAAVRGDRGADGDPLCPRRGGGRLLPRLHARAAEPVQPPHPPRDQVRLVPGRARRAPDRAADPAAGRRLGRHPQERRPQLAAADRRAQAERTGQGQGRPGMSMLSVKDVTVRFGGITALDKVSLDLNRGEILGLIGPNGAGKTTLFNCISGVFEPDEGVIRHEGRSLRGLKPHQRAQRGIARTFQNLQLWPTMTVLDNIKVPVDAIGKRNLLSDALGLPYSVHAEKAATEQARAILHVLDLLPHEHTLAGDLPVGLQRKVELARALAMRPRLLLLDEPAAGLDAEETVRLADLLTLVRDRFKVSMLLVDHDMSLVMRACHYIYVLDFGKLLARGRPEE